MSDSDSDRRGVDAREPPSRGDAEFLDEFFEAALEAVQEGREIPYADLHPGRAHLAAAAERLADLARFLADSGAQPRPVIAGYTVVAELGRGGMASVYLARQERLGGRLVALKVLPPHIAMSPTARARFKAEALAIAGQRHRGVVQAYDVVEDGPLLAYAMEWVDGRSLDQIIDHLALSTAADPPGRMAAIREFLDVPPAVVLEEGYWGFVARVGATSARALESVHAAGILHRDVKPSNILIRRDGSALLSDFGLAKLAEGPGLTVGQTFMGTATYAPPEQLMPSLGGIDARSDVFALGATLAHALRLRAPWSGRGPAEVLQEIRGASRTGGVELAGVPGPLADIVAKAMRLSPGDRYTGAAAMAEDLERYCRHLPITAGPRRRGRSRVFILGALLVAVAGGAGGVVWRISGVSPWSPGGGATRASEAGAAGDGRPVRLWDPAGAIGDHFGSAVAARVDRIAVGSPEADGAAGGGVVLDAGAVSVYVLEGSGWRLESRVEAPDPSMSAYFGSSVAITEDLLVVGARGVGVGGVPRAGAVYVYRRQGGGWAFAQRLTAVNVSADAEFGAEVAADGDTIAVCAVWNVPVNERGEGGPGALYRVTDAGVSLVKTVEPQSVQAVGTLAGSCDVACGGRLAVFGFGWCNTPVGENAGQAQVFVREVGESGGWKLAQTVMPLDMHPHSNLGWEVGIDPDPSAPLDPEHATIAVAIPSMNAATVNNAGAVRLLLPRPGPSWVAGPDLRNPMPRLHSRMGSPAAFRHGFLAAREHAPGDGALVDSVLVFRPARDDRSVWMPPSPVRIDEPKAGDDLGSALAIGRTTAGLTYLVAGTRLWDEDKDVQEDRGAAFVWTLRSAGP